MAEKEKKNNLGNTVPKGNKKPAGGVNFTPKFNPIYIYGILLVAFFAIQYYTSSGTPVETSWQEVKNTMLKNGDIDKVVVVNKSQADIYLKEASYDKYKSKLNTGFGSPAKIGPHFFFTIGSIDVFEKNLEAAQLEYGENSRVTLTYEIRHDYFSEILSWLFLPLILIAVWFWIFRRMSKGGGSGGNIFNDEIDAIGRARGRNPNMGSNDERENTLNQLLTEMDGFDTNSGVIILGATNRADILDRALMRAGRFDRQIHVELPDVIDRKEIFMVHLRPLTLSEDVNVNFLAKQTPGFSGADIANVCNEAALIAARRKKTKVEKQDFLDAVDRIVGGLEKKNKIITADEKAIIAYHEAGHATVSWLLEHAHPLVKVTIVPRGKALGAAWYLPEERQITTREQMLDEVCATLGGRAAETVVFSKISSGAQNDLEKVTKTAYSMICYFGMSDKVGNVSYYDSSGQSDYSFNKPYSEKTAELIDSEIKELIDLAFARAKDILVKNAAGHKKLAELLLEREVIFTEDMENIFGVRPWGKKKDDENPLKDEDTLPSSLESEITKS